MYCCRKSGSRGVRVRWRILLEPQRNAYRTDDRAKSDGERLWIEDSVLDVMEPGGSEILKDTEDRQDTNGAESVVIGFS